MYRTVFIPTETDNMIPFNIPRAWYGRNIEVIVFPIDMDQNLLRETVKKDELKFEAVPSKYSFATRTFKFNRDEANDYE